MKPTPLAVLTITALLAAAVPAQGLRSLVRDLNSKSASERLQAVRALSVMGPEAARAAGALGKVLADDDEVVAKAAGVALARIGDKALPVLKKAIRDRDSAEQAIAAAGYFGEKALVFEKDLIKALKHDLYEVQYAAVATFGKIGAPAVPALLKALESRATTRRAAEALGAIGPAAEAAIPDLVRIMNDPRDEDDQRGAIEALGDIEAVDQLPRLVELAGREVDTERVWYPVQSAAVAAIGAMGPKAAKVVPDLILLADRIPAGERSVGQATRAGIVRTLGRIGPAAAQGSVLAQALLAGSPDESTQDLARTALVAMDPDYEGEAEHYGGNLRHKDPGVRERVAVQLGTLGEKAAKQVEGLMARAEGDDVEAVRVAAITSLGQLGSHAADVLDRLEILAIDGTASDTVREAATTARERIQRAGAGGGDGEDKGR